MTKTKKIKPHICILLLAFLVVAAIIFINVNKRTQVEGTVDCKKFLFENKSELQKIAQNLMILNNQYLTFYMDSNEIVAYDNGKPINIYELWPEEDMVDSIMEIFRNTNLEYIDKWDDYLQFGFYDNNFQYGISYTYDKNKLSCYTDIKDLGENWYYWFISMPDDNMD